MVTTCRKSSLRVKPPVTSNHTLFQYVRIFSINVKIRASSIRSANFKSGLRSDQIFFQLGSDPISKNFEARNFRSDPNRIIRSAKSARMPFPGFDFVSRASSRRRDWREHDKIRLISLWKYTRLNRKSCILSQYQIDHNILVTLIYRDMWSRSKTNAIMRGRWSLS